MRTIVTVKIIILLFVLLLSWFGAVDLLQAQSTRWTSYTHPLRFHHLTVQDGLSQGTVLCIHQDNKGFMWFGTEDGLNRYDGYTFRVFRPDEDNPHSIGSNYIKCLYEDRQDRLWIGFNSGRMDRFDRENEHFIHYFPGFDDPGGSESGLGSYMVNAIAQDRLDRLWIGTGGGLKRMLPEGYAIYLHEPDNPESLTHNNINSLYVDTEDTFWIGTTDGLNRMVPAPGKDGRPIFTRYPVPRSIPGADRKGGVNSILAIDEDRFGRLWLGTEDGLLCFDPTTRIYKYFPALPGDPAVLGHNIVRSIFKDRFGILWVGTDGGGFHKLSFPGDGPVPDFKHFFYMPDYPGGLSGNGIQCMYEDSSGVLWIGVYMGGVNKLVLYGDNEENREYEPFDHYQVNPNGLSHNSINAILEDRRGELWIGTDGGGINRVIPARDENKPLTFRHIRHDPGNPASLCGDVVVSMLEDRAGWIWIGTYMKGISRFKPAGGNRAAKSPGFQHFRHNPDDPDSLSHDFVSCFCEDAEGNMWVGTINGGLNRYDPKTGGFTRYPYDAAQPGYLRNASVTALLEDRSKTLWVGTVTGLHRFQPESKTFEVYVRDKWNPNSLNNNYIRSLYQDSGGQLWVGTDGGGLNRMITPPNSHEQPRFIHYTDKDGLPNNVVLSILEDDSGHLWLSTNKGLSRFSVEQGTVVNYDISDGLQGYDFNVGAAFKSRSGELFFGGSNGFNVFDPRTLPGNPQIPRVVITDLLIFNRSVPIGERKHGPAILSKSITETPEITLSYQDYVVSLQYAALHYVDPGKNRYAYIMEGLDQEWSEVGNRRFATFTTLPPGEYVFRVNAANNDGVWNEQGATLKIKVVPPFWRTWWFALGLVLVVAVLLAGFYRWRVNQLKRRREELRMLVDRRTRQFKEASEEARRERAAADAANQSKSEFLARMSHEIRTPMNAIIGFTDMLMNTDLNEEQADFTSTINRSGEALISLLNDILDFSKIEAGELAFESIDFDPEVMMYDICEMIQPRLEGKDIEMLCRVGSGVPAYVRADAGRLRQVVVNLMGNAVKFTGKGEIELSLTVAEEEADTLILHTIVRDTGPGIPADKLETIFKEFQQADGSITRRYGGTGLGLAICKQIARLMDGDVWAESIEGRGSSFHFTARVKQSSKKSGPGPIHVELGGKRVLAVDDNVTNLEILTHMLEREGLSIKALSVPAQAVPALEEAVAGKEPFDLVIIDILMPEISGFDLAKEIKKMAPPICDLPLLAFSSAYHSGQQTVDKRDFDGFLPKPARRERMLQMIERLLGVGERESLRKTPETTVTRHSIAEEAKHSVRILLVEDNAVNRKLVHFMLTKAGYSLTMVENGREAVDTYTASPENFDLILMDIQMPELDGRQATREIRKKGFSEVPIIALTAESIKGDREKAMEAGMNDYITKPVKREDVFGAVKKWCCK